jgi:hypothetical protein
MRYIKISGGTGYCGTDFEEYIKTDMTDEQLEAYCSEAAYENAEQYDYMVYGWGEDAESHAEYYGISLEEAEAEMDEYYAEATAEWEETTEEEWQNNRGIIL